MRNIPYVEVRRLKRVTCMAIILTVVMGNISSRRKRFVP